MHGLIEGRVRLLGAARWHGRLYDLGAYPGATDPVTSRDRVMGELFAFGEASPEPLLDSLDRYEGEAFERVVRDVDGPISRCRAFVYLYRGNARAGRWIRSGDYLATVPDPLRRR
jgi:gamma-glutamylcyclotransferase (GGCT)/AIG2-like uncharacterized protein YtfP